ncbi:MAG: MMPL family transporter [Bacteroidota bacterium]
MVFSRKLILLFIALFTGINLVWLTSLRFDFDIENLFPKQDEDLVFFQSHLQQFQSDKQYLIVGIEAEHGIFNQGFLQQFAALTTELDSSEWVQTASSITNIRYHKLDALQRLRDQAFLHPDDPDRYASDSIFLESYADVAEKFISSQKNAVSLFLELSPELTPDEHPTFLQSLRQQLEKYGFYTYHFSGAIDTEQSFVEQLKSELILLLSLSLVFILVVLYLTFRSRWGVLAPFGIISLSVLWTIGTMAAFGVAIHTLTVVIPSIITIVALSDVIHLMARFQEELAVAELPKLAMQLSIKDIGLAIFLTSLTTAFGFLTLSTADIQPFIEFGVFTAMGVIYAWFLTIFLLPPLLEWIGNIQAINHVGQLHVSEIELGFQWILRSRFFILGLAVVLIGISLVGVGHLRVDSTLYEELSAGDEYSASLNFFDQQFAGIRPVEIYLECLAPDESILDQKTLQKIDLLEKYLSHTYRVHSLYSINTQVKRIHRSMKRGRARFFVLPEASDTTTYGLIRFALDSAYDQLELRSILSADYRSTMIAAKINDLGSWEIGKRNEALEEYLQELFPAEDYIARVTGKALLLDKSNEVISRNLGLGLLIALLVVALLMGLLFRSVPMAFIALIPNLLPLLFVAGLMGWIGIGLKMSTAIIYTIAFGIAVDDTIHFLSRFRSEIKKTSSVEEALRRTYLSTGKAILITSLILVLGFGILMFSAFRTTFLTGMFISLSLLFAVFADLFLLPVLLRWVYGR